MKHHGRTESARRDPAPSVIADQEAASPGPLRHHLVGIIENGPVPVVVLEPDGRIHWSNRAFEDLFPASEGVRHFQSLLDPGSKRLLEQLGIAQAAQNGPIELRHVTPLGRRLVKYQFFSCSDGRVGAIGSDRTEEMELVEQMSALVEDLYREIAQRAELSRELERMATTDFLTGLFNRRQFDKVLQEEWSRMRRYHSHFALLIFDLDHFKRVNDQYGHQVGDEVLRRVAETIRGALRGEDVVARYGGEEFAVIALAATARTACELAERLRRLVADAQMPGGVPGQTISVGVASTASLPATASLPFLITAADHALYEGKQRGRNRVEVWSGQEPEGSD